MASTIQVDKIQDTGGNTILSSNSTGTFTYEVASGANFTALDADNVSAGTLAIARGGTGAATLAAAGLVNTPSFSAYTSADSSFTDATWSKAPFNTETFDSDGCYDTTNYRFTPAVAGKYLFLSTVILSAEADSNFDMGGIRLYKNGATIAQTFDDNGANFPYKVTFNLSAVDISDTDDYYEIYIYCDDTSGSPIILGGTAPIDSSFTAMKIIGA